MFWQVIGSIFSTASQTFIDHGLQFLREKMNSMSGSENLERNFESLMARADDLKNEISIQVQRGKKREREEVRVWFRDVKKVKREFRTFKKEEKGKGFMKQIFGGHQAMQLNASICDLEARSRLFGEHLLGDDSMRGQARPTIELEGEAFKDNFKRIWNCMENDKVSSLGVHGMGGVGKSTLLEHINNHLLKINKCVLWIVVCQECSVRMLQNKIASKLKLVLLDEDDEGERAGILNHVLSQRENFVLILDDVWERIDLVKVGVPLSLEGCKWMMTSRSLKLCQEMNCQEKIAVNPLSKDEGWKLFLKNVGQDAELALKDPEVKDIAKLTVEICNGLPLAIITLAGAMSGVTDIQEWRHALRVLKNPLMGPEWMEEKVFPVLKYSFDRLSPNDQRCFLYCSLYPEDFPIQRKELLNNFISEGLVDIRKSSRAAQLDEGHSVLTRLVKVSLLESDLVTGDCVKMHDLVRAMALKITKSKTMVLAGHHSQKEIPIEEEYWTVDLEKVSLMHNSIKGIPHGISPNCPKLSTLLLQRNPLSKGIATSFFSRMLGLCTLYLSGTRIKELPNSVSDLVNLTSLFLGSCTRLRRVPCLGKLKELRELDVSHTAIEEFPQGMKELVNIRCLLMNGAYKLVSTRLELKSPWLQHLRLPYNIETELVEGDGRLEEFEGWLTHISDFKRLAASRQDGVSYCILVTKFGSKYPVFQYRNDVGRRLIVYSYNLEDGEDKKLTILTDYIQGLELISCAGLSKCLLDYLSNPRILKKLNVEYSEGIECMLTYDQFKAPQHQSKSRFQALEDIYLNSLKDFVGVIHNWKVEAAAPPTPTSVFSSLRRLTISHCGKMKYLGLPLSIIERLEDISIRYCDEIEEIIQEDDGSVISLPNLKKLSLVELTSLESFCEAPVICNSIEIVELKNCPRLEEPSLNRGTPDSYKPLFAGL